MNYSAMSKGTFQYQRKAHKKGAKTTKLMVNQLDLFMDFSQFSPVVELPFAAIFNDLETLTTPESKFNANITALQMVKELSMSKRSLTHKEQQVLLSYSGWGGLSQVFEEYKKDSVWKKRQSLLKAVVTEQEFAQLRKSVTTAYYTPFWLIRQIWDAVRHLGFTGGHVLEPAVGIGHFFGLMPDDLKKHSQLTGVELNPLSAKIAQCLYPKSKIQIAGFETVSFPQSSFDLVIGNVPFGDFSVYDAAYNKYNLKIHNYFLVRSLDLVRPGGLGIFITSTGTMQSDREGSIARKLCAERADLLAAYRLPKGAFTQAGTDVAVDVLLFQKRKPLTPSASTDWVQLGSTDLRMSHNDAYAKISDYYIQHPSHLLGNLSLNTRWGNSVTLEADGRDIEMSLNKLINKLPEGIVSSRDTSKVDELLQRQFLEKRIRHGGYLIDENDVVCYLVDGNSIPVEKNNAVIARIRGMIKIKEIVQNLLQMQLANYDDTDLEEKRSQLNQAYDNFARLYGLIHNKDNEKAFVGDKDHGLLLALEEVDKERGGYKKSAIFYKRTIYPFRKIERTDSAKEALIVSLQESGKVVLERIMELTGQSQSEVISELKGHIYFDPQQKKWQTAEEYLSGYVIKKLAVAKAAAEQDPMYGENVTALEAVQPQDLAYNEIEARLGANWIPATDIALFACSLLGEDKEAVSVLYMPSIGEWKVKLENSYYAGSVGNTRTWGTQRMSAVVLLEHALNQKIPEVRDCTWDAEKKKEVYVVNQKETLAARQQMENIKNHFRVWVWEDMERRQRLSAYYNEHFNNIRLRMFDGSHMEFPGLNVNIRLRKHQKNAVWRILQTKGNTLIGHVVGAGKTYTMQVAGMELKRLGLANKPLYTVPNANFDDFVSMFNEAYPLAHLLVLKGEDLPEVATTKKQDEPEQAYLERREINRAHRFATLNQIATGEYDSIILSHELFRRIAVSPERQNEFIQMQINDLESAIRDMNSHNMESKRLVKSLENAKEKLEVHIKRDLDEERRDIAVSFEELGIDALFVDEADIFKNLYFPTKMTRIAGIQNTGSQRSMDMFMKAYTLSQQDKSVVFATGTPISNTIAEMYTLQRYLALKELRNRGLAHFDAWAATFGEVVNTLERTPDGQSWRTVSRFANFINTPELITIFRSFADIQTADDLDLPRPALKGNDRIVVDVEPSADLLYYIRTVICKRVKDIRDGKVKPWVDNMLKVTSDMRKAALDIRLINPQYSSGEESKITKLMDNVSRIWQDTKEQRSTQLIFCDLSIPKGHSQSVKATSEFDKEDAGNLVIYDEIKKLLMRKGIPSEEIAFIHDAKNQRQKEILKEKVRQGHIRVLIGSTSKMGVGINVQNKLVAEHHVDCPWRPRDIEQREGRILRQGNENKEVMIFVYVTRESADAWLWQTVKSKAKFISQAMSGKLISRTLSDIEQTTLGYAEIEAIATGNPLLIERVKVDSEVDKYSTLKNKWVADRFAMEDEIARLPNQIRSLEASLAKFKQDIALRQDTAGDNFKIVLDGTEYTARKEASKALAHIIENLQTTMTERIEEFHIGTFAGFDLYCIIKQSLISSDIEIKIKGHHVYISAPSLQSLEYAIRKYPSEGLTETVNQLNAAKKKLVDLKKEKTKEFEYETILQKAVARQQEIIQLLQIDQKAC